jgi:hypothetical protein
MPAEREEVFSSMKESLDKIAASTAAMENFFSGTLEENIEGDRAQKLRDKEQQKQTEALEKLGKSQGKAEKESSFLGKHWGKLLLGLLGLFALMKTKMPDVTEMIKNADPAFKRKNWEEAFKKMGSLDEWEKKFGQAYSGMNPDGTLKGDGGRFEQTPIFKYFDIENTGSVKETIDAAATQIPKAGAGGAQNIKIQAGRAGGLIKGLVQGPFEKFKRGARQIRKIAGLDASHKEMKKQNKEKERTLRLEEEKNKAHNKALKENKTFNEKQTKNAQQQLKNLKKENEQKQKAARIRDNAEKQSKKLNPAEKQRQNNINNTKGSLPKGIVVDPTKKNVKVDPMAKGKGGVKTAVNLLKSVGKARVGFSIGTAMSAGNPIVGTVFGLSVFAADVFAQTEKGQAFTEKMGWAGKEKEFIEHIKSKLSAAKSYTVNQNKTADKIYRQGLEKQEGTEHHRLKKLEESKKKPSWFERAKKFLRFGGREGQDAERISSNVAKIVALNPAMKDLIHISGSAFKAGGHDPMRITSGFRNKEAQRKAMEWQRKNNPAQYKKNYSMGGTLTPSDTSTETWLNKRMSKHQHGNGIDVGYPKGIKGGTPRATAFVTSINNKLAAEGFDGLAVEEGNHIHMTAGGPKTKAQADKFERDFNAFKENDQGQRLKQANQGVNGAGVNGGVTVNNYNNQSYKKTDTSNLITSGGATDPSSTGHPSANAKQ